MADWILVPCLVALRNEFNRIAPGRDKASDGSIGDTAHAGTVSDHNPDETGSVPIRDADKRNEVHAIDVDVDLRVAGLTMEKVVQFLLKRCRSGAEKRLRYIIYNRRIWEASNSWRQRTYTGASPHTEHAHFSASYDTAREAATASWHLEDIPVALTADDKKWISQQINSAVARVWEQTFTNPYDGRKMEYGTMLAYAPSRGQVEEVGRQVDKARDEILSAIEAPVTQPPVEGLIQQRDPS
jgi:hypothetical protein